METHQVNVERWSITCRKPFDSVLAAVEDAIGRPNMVEFTARVAAATTFEEMQSVINESVSEIGLMEFMRLDHGAVLAKAGVEGGPKMVRLIMGNPLIMQSMARLFLGCWHLCSGNQIRAAVAYPRFQNQTFEN